MIPTSFGYHHHGECSDVGSATEAEYALAAYEYWQYTQPPSEETVFRCNANGEDESCSASIPSQGPNLAHAMVSASRRLGFRAASEKLAVLWYRCHYTVLLVKVHFGSYHHNVQGLSVSNNPAEHLLPHPSFLLRVFWHWNQSPCLASRRVSRSLDQSHWCSDQLIPFLLFPGRGQELLGAGWEMRVRVGILQTMLGSQLDVRQIHPKTSLNSSLASISRNDNMDLRTVKRVYWKVARHS